MLTNDGIIVTETETARLIIAPASHGSYWHAPRPAPSMADMLQRFDSFDAEWTFVDTVRKVYGRKVAGFDRLPR